MFTIKIYADGHAFIRSASSVEIINQSSENYRELCEKLQVDYINSGVVDDIPGDEDRGLSSEDKLQRRLESIMPHTFMFYVSESESCKWYFHGDDTAYIINEQGKTIERVRGLSVMSSLVETQDEAPGD